jgi:hypothetical protein
MRIAIGSLLLPATELECLKFKKPFREGSIVHKLTASCAQNCGRDANFPTKHATRGNTMKKAERKSFANPDEVREFPLGKVELVSIGGAIVGRATLKPGWRWSSSVKPIAKTLSCEASHFQYHVAGTLRVVMDDGKEFDCKAGDISLLPSGHDAWVVGEEAVVVVDFQGMFDYAKLVG